MDFVAVFPVHFILIPRPEHGQYIVYGSMLPGDRKSAAFFSEEIFAERAREADCPSGVVCAVATFQQLEPHLTMFELGGLTHVTIDPGTEAAGYAVRTIEEFRRLLAGS